MSANKIQTGIAASAIAGICIILLLNIFAPAPASPEWIYTVDKINKFATPPLVAILAILLLLKIFRKRSIFLSAKAMTILFLCGCLFFAIPFFSPSVYHVSWQFQYFLSFCWCAGLLSWGLLSLVFAARLPGAWSMLLCAAGSVLLGLGAVEGYLAATKQPADGIANASAHSRFVKDGAIPEPVSWQNSVCGGTLAAPGQERRIAHRMEKFGEPVFDVFYSMNADGKRKLPDRMTTEKERDLLLFGCSYTFGHSLADQETWPWQLATMLGPSWKIEDYSIIGAGASQMLCLLEHNLVTPPTAKERYAIFLAIKDHIRRNDFYPGTPHYILNSAGEAEAGGKGRFNTLHRLPEIFNGSQLAREASVFGSNIIMKKPEPMIDLYLATLKKSAEILKSRYDTQLIVLLWPDADNLAPQIRQLHLPLLMVKDLLPGWDKDGGASWYVSPWDGHPNAKAARLIADGLAKYLEKLE